MTKKTLRPKLHVWKELRCGGRTYPKGSLLPWRDQGLPTRKVLQLLRLRYLSEEQWPGHEGEPFEPEDIEVETGEMLEKRLAQESEEKQAREDMLKERKLELMGEGASDSAASSQAAGELAVIEHDLQHNIDDDEEVEAALKLAKLEECKRLEAEEKSKAEEKARLEAEEKAKQESEGDGKSEDDKSKEQPEQSEQPQQQQ